MLHIVIFLYKCVFRINIFFLRCHSEPTLLCLLLYLWLVVESVWHNEATMQYFWNQSFVFCLIDTHIYFCTSCLFESFFFNSTCNHLNAGSFRTACWGFSIGGLLFLKTHTATDSRSPSLELVSFLSVWLRPLADLKINEMKSRTWLLYKKAALFFFFYLTWSFSGSRSKKHVNRKPDLVWLQFFPSFAKTEVVCILLK